MQCIELKNKIWNKDINLWN